MKASELKFKLIESKRILEVIRSDLYSVAYHFKTLSYAVPDQREKYEKEFQNTIRRMDLINEFLNGLPEIKTRRKAEA